MSTHEDDETLGAELRPGSDATPAPSDTLAGRYRILGMLGVGGMGAVYRVRDLELEEVVALKTLRHGFVDTAGALERFRREVKLARKVTHPNVARTFDIGEHRGASGTSEKFLTMEYVEGVSLGRRLEEGGALPIGEASRIASSIAAALEAAHAAGVVHRDLKPDNVLLERESGRVVVTDFGIARSRVEDGNATAAGAVVGTPAYMAPEQVEGTTIDGRADLYALGLVLYEMLVGTPAFTGATPFALAAARLVAPAPDPLRACPTLAPSLAALVSKLLARRPQDRPASAAEVRAVLETPSVITTSPAAQTIAIVPEAARSIAVMPLRTEGPSEDAWLAEGATTDLVDALSMVRGLRVRAHATLEPGEDARAFGRRMGVELVASGGMRRANDAIRLTVRLTSTVDGFQIWAGRSEGSLGELLVMTDRAAREISGAIAGAESTRIAPAADSPEVIAMHVRARKLISAIPSDETVIDQIEAMRAAAGDHPRLLASLAVSLARVAGVRGPDRMARARATAERAIELAPQLGEPWVALAHVRLNDGDTAGAARALRRALRNGPSVAEAHDLAGRILHEADEEEDAVRFLDRALWLDPQLSFARVDRARMFALRGDWDHVIQEIEILETTSPVHHVASVTRYRLWTDRELAKKISVEHAGILREFLELNSAIARAHCISDEVRARMRAQFAQARPGTRIARLYHQLQCEMHAYVGEYDEAVAHLGACVENGLEDRAWLRRCPVLDPLRSRPEMTQALDTLSARSQAILAAWREG